LKAGLVTTYDATAAALTVVELSPLAALRLAHVLLQTALHHLGQDPEKSITQGY
jgi:hypothetical protein